MMIVIAGLVGGIVGFLIGTVTCTLFLLWLGWGPDDDDDDDDSDDASGSRWMVDPGEPGIWDVEPERLPKITELVKP